MDLYVELSVSQSEPAQLKKILGQCKENERVALPGIWYLRGLCHEMNNCFEGLKNQISTFFIFNDGFKILLLPKNIEDKVLACFYENTY